MIKTPLTTVAGKALKRSNCPYFRNGPLRGVTEAGLLRNFSRDSLSKGGRVFHNILIDNGSEKFRLRDNFLCPVHCFAPPQDEYKSAPAISNTHWK